MSQVKILFSSVRLVLTKLIITIYLVVIVLLESIERVTDSKFLSNGFRVNNRHFSDFFLDFIADTFWFPVSALVCYEIHPEFIENET